MSIFHTDDRPGTEARATLLAAGVPERLLGALAVAAGLWLAVAWALGWIG